MSADLAAGSGEFEDLRFDLQGKDVWIPRRLQMVFLTLSRPMYFFALIRRAAVDLAQSEFKSTEKLIFVLMGLNHLREWIAPGYRYTKPENSPQEVFFNQIFKLNSYQLIHGLCNRSKHLKEFDPPTSLLGSLPIDDWPSVDSVTNFDHGPISGYTVDGRDLMEVIEEVMQFYEANWFSRTDLGNPSRLGED